jgi:hypothetical protein
VPAGSGKLGAVGNILVSRVMGAEIELQQEAALGFRFDYVIVCTVTGSTHAGMVVGFAKDGQQSPFAHLGMPGENLFLDLPGRQPGGLSSSERTTMRCADHSERMIMARPSQCCLSSRACSRPSPHAGPCGS